MKPIRLGRLTYVTRTNWRYMGRRIMVDCDSGRPKSIHSLIKRRFRHVWFLGPVEIIAKAPSPTSR